ncbi:hypothetical protein MHLP_02085 [Candidatus Mycoplasma haematolamae str. Purdue]|uniref:Uncharacterized protein n=1 Tax=Mycoplasma haematolamae (strain Purdue) TaxID=1212765 RepID=I7C682_MYCHA|nr:hypothetical protein [Candidatus Mycoplasma haematolamae]AFO51997.1 hypothetical protein MHLP_02085 [Candidatus Mycoplasma haematolamae str. Purdue]
MSLSIIKAVALVVSGFGVATGGVGSGYYFLVKPALTKNSQLTDSVVSVVKTSERPQTHEQVAEATPNTSTEDNQDHPTRERLSIQSSDTITWLVTRPQDTQEEQKLDDLEEDDEEEIEVEIPGSLAILKGLEDSVENVYKLTTYYSDSELEGSEVLVKGISFRAVKDKADKCVSDFNRDVWVTSPDLSVFLEQLSGEKNKLEKVFKDSVYSALVSSIEQVKVA